MEQIFTTIKFITKSGEVERNVKNMETKKEQYDEIMLAKERLGVQISTSANNDQVANNERKLYTQLEFDKFSSCNHIWVNTLCDYDRSEGRSYNYCGCIKCGLDQRVFHFLDYYPDLSLLSLDQEIMYEFMRNHYYKGGIYTKVLCDLDLAKAIYSKIKEVHPDIDDETARKYFEIALDNIRNIKVSEERKISRAKRLSLMPKFNKWAERDVSSN